MVGFFMRQIADRTIRVVTVALDIAAECTNLRPRWFHLSLRLQPYLMLPPGPLSRLLVDRQPASSRELNAGPAGRNAARIGHSCRCAWLDCSNCFLADRQRSFERRHLQPVGPVHR